MRQAYAHGSPEHWRGRYNFRATRGYDIESILAPDEYAVGPDHDGKPVVAFGVRAYRRLRELNTNPSDMAFLDQVIAHLDAENASLAEETRCG